MPKPVVSKFSSAASHFKKLLDQLKDEMGFIAHSSAETFEVYREKITQNWNVKWPETLNNYKAALKELPKGLRQRDFVQTAHAEIEKFEQELNRFSEQIKNESLDDWRRTFNKQLTQANEFMGRFQASIKRMDEVVAELEENTLVQKFLRGEPVFSCRTKLQWRRKLFHAFMGLSFLYLFVYAGLAPSTKNTIAVLFIGTAIATEILRAHSKWFGNLVCRLFGPIMREHEKTKVTAAT
ncbi:MAG TPA: hypothetical protein VJC18_04810, partial [bacterium]|nr:hypothetical protein [bacterium]